MSPRRIFARIGWAPGDPTANYAAGDRAEFVAGFILRAIEEGGAQYFANDPLRKLAGA